MIFLSALAVGSSSVNITGASTAKLRMARRAGAPVAIPRRNLRRSFVMVQGDAEQKSTRRRNHHPRAKGSQALIVSMIPHIISI